MRFVLVFALFSPSVFGGAPVFTRDVLPIFEKHCQTCHRPGDIAPFPLLTYEQARPWAKAIRLAVTTRKMPPWFADGGHFRNDRSLTADEIRVIGDWAASGAPAGDPKDAPAPLTFTEGWRIHKPDVIFDTGVDFSVPESGDVPYQYFVVPTGFKQDRWVREVEVKPGNRSAVHHMTIYVRPPGSSYLSHAVPGRPFVPAYGTGHRLEASGNSTVGIVKGLDDKSVEFLMSYVPGTNVPELAPGQAFLVRAGSDLVFQIHYTSSGKKQLDRSMVGFVFADKPARRVINATWSQYNIRIPAGQAAHREEASVTLTQDVEIRAVLPHMHLRGSGFEVHATHPSGKQESLLKLRRYDFNWQILYEWESPIRLPKGTVLTIVGIFDNSPNNPANPDPTVDVHWGDQTTSEMLQGDFRLAIPVEQNPMDLVAKESFQAEGDALEAGSWQAKLHVLNALFRLWLSPRQP